jgi:hypothetical protein
MGGTVYEACFGKLSHNWPAQPGSPRGRGPAGPKSMPPPRPNLTYQLELLPRSLRPHCPGVFALIGLCRAARLPTSAQQGLEGELRGLRGESLLSESTPTPAPPGPPVAAAAPGALPVPKKFTCPLHEPRPSGGCKPRRGGQRLIGLTDP